VTGETGGSRLITQRSEVQILPPLRRIALRRRPFLIGRAYVMLRTVTKGVVIARLGGGLAAVGGRNAAEPLGRRETEPIGWDAIAGWLIQ
jgi:hypothetical protein